MEDGIRCTMQSYVTTVRFAGGDVKALKTIEIMT
jgi:hypothetical protein